MREPGPITIPAGLAENLTPDELEAVFLHELAHAKRRDNLYASLVHMLVCMLWFHPFVRWLEQQLVTERELACDEAVLRWGVSPKLYAACILKTCQLGFSGAVAGHSGVASSYLQKRMEAVMFFSPRTMLADAPRWLIVTLFAAMTLGPTSFGLLTAPALPAQAKSQEASPAVAANATTLSCVFASREYPEGTVIQQGGGPEQMCVGIPGPVTAALGKRQRVPQWVRTNPSIRQRGASVIHVPDVQPATTFICKPKPSDSASCSCEGADSAFSSGSTVDSASGKLRCDQGQWRVPAPSGSQTR